MWRSTLLPHAGACAPRAVGRRSCCRAPAPTARSASRASRSRAASRFAQTPEDAEYDGMPRARHRHRHGRLRAAGGRDAGQAGRAVAQRPGASSCRPAPTTRSRPRPPTPARPTRRAEDALHDIMVTLRARTGHDFRHYKRATVLRRLERRHAGQRAARPAGLPRAACARDAAGDAGAAAGPADQRHQLLPRPRGVRGARARGDPRAVRRPSPAERACAPGSPAAPPARRPTRSRCCCASRPRDAGGAAGVQVFATDIDERGARRRRAPASTRRRSSPTCRRRGCASSSTARASATASASELRERVLFAAAQPAARPAVLAARPDLLPQPADLPRPRRAGRDPARCSTSRCSPGGYLFLGSSESADVGAGPVRRRSTRSTASTAPTPAARRAGVPILPLGAYPKRPQPGRVEPPADSHAGGTLSYAEVHRRAARAACAAERADRRRSQHRPPVGRTPAASCSMPAATPSHNLLALVRPELRARAAHRAVRGRAVEAERRGAARAAASRDGSDRVRQHDGAAGADADARRTAACW